MSKINYPKEGLMPLVRSMFLECSNSLSSAASSSAFDVPSDFDYRNYLWDLRSRINSLNAELSRIKNEVSTSDHAFENVSVRASIRIRLYDNPRVKPRNRMIE